MRRKIVVSCAVLFSFSGGMLVERLRSSSLEARQPASRALPPLCCSAEELSPSLVGVVGRFQDIVGADNVITNEIQDRLRKYTTTMRAGGGSENGTCLAVVCPGSLDEAVRVVKGTVTILTVKYVMFNIYFS
jgi:hypothetical protein